MCAVSWATANQGRVLGHVISCRVVIGPHLVPGLRGVRGLAVRGADDLALLLQLAEELPQTGTGVSGGGRDCSAAPGYLMFLATFMTLSLAPLESSSVSPQLSLRLRSVRMFTRTCVSRSRLTARLT